jgi:hypothetical protein
VVAERSAREVGHVDLRKAPELCALIATHDRERGMRAGTRWLNRWLDQTDGPRVDEVAMVAAALAALGGSGRSGAQVSPWGGCNRGLPRMGLAGEPLKSRPCGRRVLRRGPAYSPRDRAREERQD